MRLSKVLRSCTRNATQPAVAAAQPVAWFIGRAPEGLVVAPVVRILAPGIVRADAADRQQGPRPWQAVGAPPQPQRAKSAARGAAVAFALIGLDAGAAERNGHSQWASKQPALRFAAWPPIPKVRRLLYLAPSTSRLPARQSGCGGPTECPIRARS